MTILMMSSIVTTSPVYAQSNRDNARNSDQCPTGYGLNRGVCQAEPRYGCPDEDDPLLPGTDDICIIGSSSGSAISMPPPSEPCETGTQLEEGAFWVYPHPYDSDIHTCAIAAPMMYYCPEDRAYTGEDSQFINPESGMCEVEIHAQPQPPQMPCPSGFEINQGVCQKEPEISCHGTQVLPDGRCLVAFLSPVPPEGSPEGYVTHPDDPNSCARIIDPFPQFNGRWPLNPETGMREIKPGRGNLDRLSIAWILTTKQQQQH